MWFNESLSIELVQLNDNEELLFGICLHPLLSGSRDNLQHCPQLLIMLLSARLVRIGSPRAWSERP